MSSSLSVNSSDAKSLLTQYAPILFVLLWSTGFIGAKLGLPDAPPLKFLSLRYICVLILMGGAAFLAHAPWPKNSKEWFHIGVTGLLIHALYLGGVFVAISQGLPAGVASLVVGLQPLLTAVGAGIFLGESVKFKQWLGLALGLMGVALVLSARLHMNTMGDVTAHNIEGIFLQGGLPAAVVALLAITAGTLYQKRFCPKFDFRTGAVAQFLPSLALTGLAALLFETKPVVWSGHFIFALSWLVIVLSLGAVGLLNYLIRSGSAVNVASLFYMVPPCTAIVAWLLFDEVLSGVAMVGMGLVVWGVYWARR